MKMRYDDLLSRFDKKFRHQYGWAADALGNEKPNLQDIEENAGLEQISPFLKIRPFIKMASQNVHASSRGTFVRLGKPPFSQDPLISGPSIFGLGDPGRNAAYSITLLTGTLLMHKLTYDHLALLHAANKLTREVHEAFYEAEASVK